MFGDHGKTRWPARKTARQGPKLNVVHLFTQSQTSMAISQQFTVNWQGAIAVSETFQLSKDANGLVTFFGSYQSYPAASLNSKLNCLRCPIPAAYRPSTEIRATIVTMCNNVTIPGIMTIRPDGVIYIGVTLANNPFIRNLPLGWNVCTSYNI